MRPTARVIAALLALAFASAATIPCPGSAPATAPSHHAEATSASGASGATGVHGGHHEMATHPEPASRLEAKCACGCSDDRAARTASARLDPVTPGSVAQPPAPRPGFSLFFDLVARFELLSDVPDPIPI